MDWIRREMPEAIVRHADCVSPDPLTIAEPRRGR